LIDFINKVVSDGESIYAGRFNQSFGKLAAQERNIMYSKHLDHHLLQFDV